MKPLATGGLSGRKMDIRQWLRTASETVRHTSQCTSAQLVLVTEDGRREFSFSFSPTNLKKWNGTETQHAVFVELTSL